MMLRNKETTVATANLKGGMRGVGPTSAALSQLGDAIRVALMRGEDDETIAARLGTTQQAVRVVRKGLGTMQAQAIANRPSVFGRLGGINHPLMPTVRRPMTMTACPLRGRFASTDGANVAGWGQKRGEPRLAQALALCRWFVDSGMRFVCWFDTNFRWGLRKFNPRHARILEAVLQHEPNLFKMPPAGVTANGIPRKADSYVLQDAASVPGGLVVSNDLYRAEIEANPQAFGWLLQHPERRITGMIAANGDILLGDDGLIRIPVVDDPAYYIR
jgi:hypothetical protein